MAHFHFHFIFKYWLSSIIIATKHPHIHCNSFSCIHVTKILHITHFVPFLLSYIHLLLFSFRFYYSFNLLILALTPKLFLRTLTEPHASLAVSATACSYICSTLATSDYSYSTNLLNHFTSTANSPLDDIFYTPLVYHLSILLFFSLSMWLNHYKIFSSFSSSSLFRSRCLHSCKHTHTLSLSLSLLFGIALNLA